MLNNPYRPHELMERRKATSDAKNDTSDLTFANTAIPSSHGAAFQEVSNIKSDIEMDKVVVDVDSEAYFDEYDLGDLH